MENMTKNREVETHFFSLESGKEACDLQRIIPCLISGPHNHSNQNIHKRTCELQKKNEDNHFYLPIHPFVLSRLQIEVKSTSGGSNLLNATENFSLEKCDQTSRWLCGWNPLHHQPHAEFREREAAAGAGVSADVSGVQLHAAAGL